MSVLSLISKSDVREIPMSVDERSLFLSGWAHDEISKAYMKMPFCQRWVIHHMKTSKDYYAKGWKMFYDRLPEQKFSKITIECKQVMCCYFERST